eukprot:TRINITY_DN2638_c0_g1_i1.p1 TRINITY_DN2638_c0_g1~~TRINITY_DN2638_c0_g1_i1.p1  ORF type:complete len:398 (+),score=80.64 TRINITY_DN2638_c0_g1_i1:125-1318(+)
MPGARPPQDGVDYTAPEIPSSSAGWIMWKLHVNHSLLLLNGGKPYELHTYQLQGVDYFFRDPAGPHSPRASMRAVETRIYEATHSDTSSDEEDNGSTNHHDSQTQEAPGHQNVKPEHPHHPKTLAYRAFIHGQHAFEKVAPRAKRQEAVAEKRMVLSKNLLTQTYNEKAPKIKQLFEDQTAEAGAKRAVLRSAHRHLYGHGFWGRKVKHGDLRTLDEVISILNEDDANLETVEQAHERQRKLQEKEEKLSQMEAEGKNDECSEYKKLRESIENEKRKHRSFRSGIPFTFTLQSDGKLHVSRDEGFFQNFPSKHLLHAAGDSYVVYAGTCRLEIPDEDPTAGPIWVLDNDSGTYAPTNERDELLRLKRLLEWNFNCPGRIKGRLFTPCDIGPDPKVEV